MKTTFLLIAALLLPLSAAAITPTEPQVEQLRQAWEQACTLMEHGQCNKAELLFAEMDYKLALYWSVSGMEMPEAEQDAQRKQLRTELKEKADELVSLMQRQYECKLTPLADVLKARQTRIALLHLCKGLPQEELQQELMALTQEAEAYWTEQLNAAVVSKVEVNRKLISLLVMQVAYFNLPVSERLLALAEENVCMLEQSDTSGLGSAEELEEAREQLKWLQIQCK